MKATKSVDVVLRTPKGNEPGRVGVANVPASSARETYTVFGLVDRGGHMTFMSYDIEELGPASMVRDARRTGGWWCFHTGDQINISARELEVALYRLELLDRIPVTELDARLENDRD